MLLPLQGVTNERALTQGVASLALGYVLLPLQGVHCLHLNNSSKLDCIRFAYNCMGNKKEVLRVKIALLTKK